MLPGGQGCSKDAVVLVYAPLLTLGVRIAISRVGDRGGHRLAGRGQATEDADQGEVAHYSPAHVLAGGGFVAFLL